MSILQITLALIYTFGYLYHLDGYREFSRHRKAVYYFYSILWPVSLASYYCIYLSVMNFKLYKGEATLADVEGYWEI